jgi:glycosyltransferase involved in cell wall biosynthesis
VTPDVGQATTASDAAAASRPAMRIAHVVTFVSANGAFGGPVAVAVAQSAALARRGHTVDLLAGWDGNADIAVPQVRIGLFRASALVRGRLTSLVAPRLLRHLALYARNYDLVHLHFGRDLSSLLSWMLLRLSGTPIVLQPHGMVMPDRRITVRLIDALVCRPAFRAARQVLVLTAAEQDGVNRIAHGGARVQRIGNGIELDPRFDVERSNGPVLFLARLHPRKRVLSFAAAAAIVLRSYPYIRFRVIGPDEGDLAELHQFIREHGLEPSIEYGGSVMPGHGRDELLEASIYVLPSVREVYPVSVLEAMSVGTPVVLTADCGLAPMLRDARAAIVTDQSDVAIAAGIMELLDNEALRHSIAERAAELIRGPLSIDRVGEILELVYRSDA